MNIAPAAPVAARPRNLSFPSPAALAEQAGGACTTATREFSDSFAAKQTAHDAARMNMVKLQDVWVDRNASGGYTATARFCGDPDLIQAAVRTFQTW